MPTAALSLICLAAVAPSANAAVTPRQSHMDGTSWSEFDQVNTSTSSLALDKSRAYDGVQSAKAVFNGGANGYSRGLYHVNWQDGDDVTYGSAFYLPTGFKANMQGQVDLLRWDNWGAFGDNDDRSGVVIHRNGAGNLMRMKFGVENIDIGPAFDIPEGRWFWLEVHQKLSKTAGTAFSEVFIDGKSVSTTTAANTYGRGVDRIRYGIVAIDSAKQKTPLTLWFDRTTVSTSQAGPLGGLPAAATSPGAPPAAATSAAPTAGATGPAARGTAGRRVIKPVGRAIASSSLSGRFGPRRAIDGKSRTRWSSKFSHRQWWRTDLGRVRAISAVQINWAKAYASRYAVDVSKNGRTWKNVAVRRATGAGTATTTFRARSARYVRVRAIRSGTPYGISFWETKVLRAAR